MSVELFDEKIDAFVTASRALNNTEVIERPHWNTAASPDAIRHFAYGIGDDNPLWVDPDYAAASCHGRLLAPPTFLTSVLYPMLHGAPVEAPLSNLIGELEYRWHGWIPQDCRLNAVARQVDVLESRDRAGRRLVCVLSEVTYRNDADEILGIARGTMVRVAQQGEPLLLNRPVTRYSPEEIDRIQEAQRAVDRRHDELFSREELRPGLKLPHLVVGPMTIGDLICWQSAIGPSYRAGPLGLRDCLAAPHTSVTHPVIGWPVKYSQQHEDFHLTSQRGMPAPFDNGAMRLSQIGRQLTDWIGNEGFLRQLRIHITEPVLYGDTTWYDATLKSVAYDQQRYLVEIDITGTNQLGEINTRANAEVEIPEACVREAPIRLSGDTGEPHRKATSSKTVVTSAKAAEIKHWQPVEDLLERICDSRSGEISVIAGEERLTYAELSCRANQLASCLTAHGVTRGSVVGICLPRGLDVPVSILALLQLGAAYVPFDPAYPAAKLSAVANDTQPVLIATTTSVSGSLASLEQPILCLDTIDEQLRGEPVGRPVTDPCDEDDLAYIIPTSGTLGSSKAVGVTRGSLGRYIVALRGALDVCEHDVCLHTAAFSFSASVRQLWLPLCSGATLVIADEKTCRDPEGLFALMQKQGVTIWDTVPTFWSHALAVMTARLTDAADMGTVCQNNRLRLICVTGESLPWDVPYRWRNHFGRNARIINLYSQAETAGTVCMYPLPDEFGHQRGTVPLGWPIAGAEVYCLDEQLKPVAVGSVGEICVGGSRLAKGYVNQPKLTGERFVSNPFSNHKDARLYRTGDLGRISNDGALEFRGRADDRVKIRGFRIEPREVELALQGHPSIKQAAVVSREGSSGNSELVAFLTADVTPAPSTRELRAYLSEQLPDYMLPSVFEFLERLPATSHGKLDRSVLREVRGRPADPGRPYLAPGTPTEETVTRIWAEVLQRERVGIHDNFLELGGHSLTAIHVATRLQEAFGNDIPINVLFETADAAELSRHIDHIVAKKLDLAPPLSVMDRGSPLPVSDSQEGLWLLDQFDPGNPVYNMHWALELEGPLNRRVLEDSLSALIVHHEPLRTRFESCGNEPRQVVDAPAPIDLQVHDLTQWPADSRRAQAISLITAAARQAFDLACGRLCRATLIRETETRHILVLLVHHIVADLWSMGILIRNLLRIYEAIDSGRATASPASPIQYADFACWQRDFLRGERLEAMVEHWRTRLSGSQILELRCDRPRPPLKSDHGGVARLVIPPELTSRLRTLSREQDASLFMTMLAGFNILMYHYSGQTDLVVGCPYLGRNRRDTEDLVGLMVNMLPLRVRLRRASSFREILQQVRQVALDAYSTADLPFARLVSALNPPRSPNHSPIFQVVFELQEDPLGDVSLPGLHVQRMDSDNGTSKFDLSLSVQDAGTQLRAKMEFSSDLFDLPTVTSMLQRYRSILKEATDQPDQVQI